MCCLRRPVNSASLLSAVTSYSFPYIGAGQHILKDVFHSHHLFLQDGFEKINKNNQEKLEIHHGGGEKRINTVHLGIWSENCKHHTVGACSLQPEHQCLFVASNLLQFKMKKKKRGNRNNMFHHHQSSGVIQFRVNQM